MDKNTLLSPFEITEWDWFVMQARIHSMESRFAAYTVYYQLHDLDNLTCELYSAQTHELLEQHATTKEQLNFYRAWVEDIKHYLNTVLHNLPAMGSDLDPDRDFCYLIMHEDDYGKRILCEFRHRHINWP